eukprot:10635720-Karenia_brevis.AAC.1
MAGTIYSSLNPRLAQSNSVFCVSGQQSVWRHHLSFKRRCHVCHRARRSSCDTEKFRGVASRAN